MKSLQKGFTLIELMIVIAIIGILASIALPAYSRYMQNSANNACLGEAKAYINSAIAESALTREGIVNIFDGNACEFGPSIDTSAVASQTVTNAPAIVGTAALATAGTTAAPVKIDSTAIYIFSPSLRGDNAVYQDTACSGRTGTCELLPL